MFTITNIVEVSYTYSFPSFTLYNTRVTRFNPGNFPVCNCELTGFSGINSPWMKATMRDTNIVHHFQFNIFNMLYV